MKNRLSAFLTAVRFLTILPVPWGTDRDHHYFSTCYKYFSVVGGLIGGGALLLTWTTNFFLPQPLLCCIVLLYLAAISGFLHLDGLADSADGFFSARPRSQILEIMHDSRSGAMGVIVINLLLLFKFAALLSIPAEKILWGALYMPLAGRCAIVATMAWLPYAGKEKSLGKQFYGQTTWSSQFISAFVFCICGLFSGFALMFFACVSVVLTSFLFGTWCRKKIGGATGDTLGAVCELTETVTALFFAIYFFYPAQ
ncbi:MAG: adenosylcobinamide-GDP ribazoletransferase [Desulfopila sp.]|jgi:adenosylcobinamide-GDP ribazoletransferase|nr:adenosylcobinamide-GDP ribazoletransferase [Desulfopila sp.]